MRRILFCMFPKKYSAAHRDQNKRQLRCIQQYGSCPPGTRRSRHLADPRHARKGLANSVPSDVSIETLLSAGTPPGKEVQGLVVNKYSVEEKPQKGKQTDIKPDRIFGRKLKRSGRTRHGISREIPPQRSGERLTQGLQRNKTRASIATKKQHRSTSRHSHASQKDHQTNSARLSSWRERESSSCLAFLVFFLASDAPAIKPNSSFKLAAFSSERSARLHRQLPVPDLTQGKFIRLRAQPQHILHRSDRRIRQTDAHTARIKSQWISLPSEAR